MKFIYPKRLICLTALCALTFLTTTCKKKIADYPFEMEGIWFSDDGFCALILVIEKSGNGKLFNYSGGFCLSGDVNTKGKVKFKKDVLYVDKKKFTIFNEPNLVTSNDSVYAPYEYDLTGENLKMYKALARMTLQEKGLLSFNETFTFVKYVDY